MSGSAIGAVRFVVPDGVDDPARVSGGNVYDARLRDALRARGVEVRMAEVARSDGLASALAAIPDDSLVLIDGLLGVPGSAELTTHADRLRIVVLAHMVASALPGGGTAAQEAEALGAARRVVTTSEWTRAELVARDLVDADRVTVARPGAEPVPAAAGSGSGGRLLCVGVIAAHKGQDLLVDALAGIADLPGWTCSIVGSVEADPAFARRVAAAIEAAGLGARVTLDGVLTGARLEAAYEAADLVVAPSRAESYGMVVAEALARGIPVVAARVGGVPEVIGDSRAAVLVPPDDASALGGALRAWWRDPERRAARKAEAVRSRPAPRDWAATAADVLRALEAAGADPVPVGAGPDFGPGRGAA